MVKGVSDMANIFDVARYILEVKGSMSTMKLPEALLLLSGMVFGMG